MRYKVISIYINLIAFFFAFPIILIFGQNFSFYLFILIWLNVKNKINVFRISNQILALPLFFAIGAIISVINLDAKDSDSLSRSLIVLPNYIYWSLLVIMLVNLRDIINLSNVSRYTMLGVVLTIFYYYVQSIFSGFSFILNSLSPNSFSFILICFAAPCFIYLSAIKQNKLFAFLFLVVSVLYLISEGRRAGTMLVLLPCLLAFLFSKIEVKRLFFGFFLFMLAFVIMQRPAAEKLIESLNPRIYSMLYESENITTQDQSYLTRRLQVEKAGLIFEDHPITGIGLNNFSNYNVKFEGNFAGAEIVENKKGMNNKSAHNSYISLLAEGGLLLLLPLLILFLYNFIHFVNKYNIRSQIENAYYWSFCAMCIHLYFITGIVNVYAWFLIGIVTMLSVKYSNKYNEF